MDCQRDQRLELVRTHSMVDKMIRWIDACIQ